MNFRIQNHTCVGIRVLFVISAIGMCYFSFNDGYHAFMILLFACSTPLLTSFSARVVLRRLMIPFLFVSVAALTVAVSISVDTGMFPFVKLELTKASQAFALQLFLKSMSVMAVVSLGIAMISLSEMIAFLKYFRFPSLLIELMVMVHHSIQIIGHKTTKSFTAQRSRLAYAGNVNGAFKSFSLLLSSTLSTSLSQIQQQAIALDARCYNDQLVWVLPKKDIRIIQLLWLAFGLSVIIIPLFIF